jgi:hypothetical protein
MLGRIIKERQAGVEIGKQQVAVWDSFSAIR